MGYLVGIVLALAIGGMGTLVGFDRDRAFYPFMAMIVASYYVLFAVMGGSGRALVLESVGMGGFMLVAILAFRRNLWLAAAALFGHGVFDFFHGAVIANPGVPPWWPAFCMSYDVAASAYLAALLFRAKRCGKGAGSLGAAPEFKARPRSSDGRDSDALA